METEEQKRPGWGKWYSERIGERREISFRPPVGPRHYHPGELMLGSLAVRIDRNRGTFTTLDYESMSLELVRFSFHYLFWLGEMGLAEVPWERHYVWGWFRRKGQCFFLLKKGTGQPLVEQELWRTWWELTFRQRAEMRYGSQVDLLIALVLGNQEYPTSERELMHRTLRQKTRRKHRCHWEGDSLFDFNFQGRLRMDEALKKELSRAYHRAVQQIYRETLREPALVVFHERLVKQWQQSLARRQRVEVDTD